MMYLEKQLFVESLGKKKYLNKVFVIYVMFPNRYVNFSTSHKYILRYHLLIAKYELFSQALKFSQ